MSITSSRPSLRAPGGLAAARLAALRNSFRAARPSLALYLAIRSLGLLVLVLWSASTGKSAHVLLSRRWDSLWYTRVAEHGYDFTLQAPDGRSLSGMAFFPLLPWLEEGLSAVSPLSLPDAGLVVSALASVAAAWGIHAVASHVHGPRAGLVLVGLWAALPVGIVQSMAYSESLFVALAAWSLYSVLTGRWITAGLLSLLAGLTRPIGLAVCAALIVAALLATADSLRTRRRLPDPVAAMAVGCAIAPLGAAGFVLWVGHRQGHPLGYLDVQAGWGNGFDGGIAFARFLSSFAHSGVVTVVVVVLLFLLAAWPHRIGLRQGQPVALVVYSAVVTLLALGASGYFGSKPRLLMPAFPLLLPLAVVLARSRPAYLWATLTTLTAAGAVYGAFWLNGSGPP
ncbi:hypothetical protein ABZY19_01175 [Streptomyces sp. NPDC006475]|uniref:hypothetical protein n=1 Tax=Streptomyces sp. NPDC006475 TaxID=3155719 RepID=UPI0033BC764C